MSERSRRIREEREFARKTCTRCGELKSITAFHRDSNKPAETPYYGRRAACADCLSVATGVGRGRKPAELQVGPTPEPHQIRMARAAVLRDLVDDIGLDEFQRRVAVAYFGLFRVQLPIGWVAAW